MSTRNPFAGFRVVYPGSEEWNLRASESVAYEFEWKLVQAPPRSAELAAWVDKFQNQAPDIYPLPESVVTVLVTMTQYGGATWEQYVRYRTTRRARPVTTVEQTRPGSKYVYRDAETGSVHFFTLLDGKRVNELKTTYGANGAATLSFSRMGGNVDLSTLPWFEVKPGVTHAQHVEEVARQERRLQRRQQVAFGRIMSGVFGHGVAALTQRYIDPEVPPPTLVTRPMYMQTTEQQLNGGGCSCPSCTA